MDLETFSTRARMPEPEAVQFLVRYALGRDPDGVTVAARISLGFPPLRAVSVATYTNHQTGATVTGKEHPDPYLAEMSARSLFAREFARALTPDEHAAVEMTREIRDPLGEFDPTEPQARIRYCATCGKPENNHPYRHIFRG